MKTHTPTSYGDWQMIDGELVDVSKLPPAQTSEAAAPAAGESQGHGEGAEPSANTPKRGKRGKRT